MCPLQSCLYPWNLFPCKQKFHILSVTGTGSPFFQFSLIMTLWQLGNCQHSGGGEQHWQDQRCHVTSWHPLSREAWHMLGHDCDLQTDQTLGSPPSGPRRLSWHFIINTDSGASDRGQHHLWDLGLGQYFGSNSIKDCPMFHREQVWCQNHQNQINQYNSEHALYVPIILHIRAHVPLSLKLWLAASECDMISAIRYPLLPPLPACLTPLVSMHCFHILNLGHHWVLLCGRRLLL